MSVSNYVLWSKLHIEHLYILNV